MMNNPASDTPRYALYFAPQIDSPWWQAGSAWLGRCAAHRQILAAPPISGISREQHQQLTAAPRRYGWHATLKAPFTLAAEHDQHSLLAAVRQLARQLTPFTLPSLELTRLDDFLALVPDTPSPAIQHLADCCVTDLHMLAAPLSEAEWQRRRAAGLSAAQEALLLRWGYPYVLEEFRFHFSLSGSLRNTPTATAQYLMDAAQSWFAPLGACELDSISVFIEPASGADFVLLEQIGLGT
ncbi:DUF1045 domain-containing protein [Neisseriaceae bacterium TC5R-5]|nr:DUF1045 domain-containing protein [Neisseriaceae bacterium TC5R-5]